MVLKESFWAPACPSTFWQSQMYDTRCSIQSKCEAESDVNDPWSSGILEACKEIFFPWLWFLLLLFAECYTSVYPKAGDLVPLLLTSGILVGIEYGEEWGHFNGSEYTVLFLSLTKITKNVCKIPLRSIGKNWALCINNTNPKVMQWNFGDICSWTHQHRKIKTFNFKLW